MAQWYRFFLALSLCNAEHGAVAYTLRVDSHLKGKLRVIILSVVGGRPPESDASAHHCVTIFAMTGRP